MDFFSFIHSLFATYAKNQRTFRSKTMQSEQTHTQDSSTHGRRFSHALNVMDPPRLTLHSVELVHEPQSVVVPLLPERDLEAVLLKGKE